MEIVYLLVFFSFLNILLRSLYRINFTIIGHGFSPGCFDWPILWLLPFLWGAISISKFRLIVSIMISSFPLPVTSLIPCRRRQFLFEYCSFWSAYFSSFETLISCSLVDFVIKKISFIWFSTFLKQLKRISTHAGDFKLSAKTSSDILLKLLILLFSSMIFFGSSPLFPSFDWSLRSLFFDDLS